jgi:hypothetical protein
VERTWLPAILPGLEKARTTDYTALNDDELLHTLTRCGGIFSSADHPWLD